MMPKQDEILLDVRRALQEDIGDGDVSAALLSSQLMAEAEIISREPMLVCGRPWVDAVFKEVSMAIELNWLVNEGAWLNQPATLCLIQGPADQILTAERTALNFLQTLSGTATQTYHYLFKLRGTKTRLLDTRKTIPGLRMAQKYAVSCAGGNNHRMGLFDAFLIKENHIKSCGSITKAIAQARKMRGDLFVEVEVETLEELQEALVANPDRILLDNFTNDMLVEAVRLTQNRCELEASGGVSLSTIASIAQTGVDYISVGAVTKSVQAIDLSLLIRKLK
ncbi:nicotinate-nucleotide pyrophosphorylase [Legionella lansingensis]|uniref:nicotinate-nucleotide diphosphorylase (carboxylating) n=1 Tax=Legionella lansingensis TaxID=45067 RepID=A0A0W0VPF3_9GAMM|nr:carboxylating nicotinate-nucleotide diphosphorylase [Legionella lansingensis]KTD21982.1 nicotinate-nucleotide pyrophosphorylase [Legionella lansingensis]SNV51617.1 nicotinate-nucleotide pyrophosphorylase [Legionella lansingensis]